NAFAEIAGLRNNPNNDKSGRGFARQPQMRQRFLKSRIVAGQTKLGPVRQKVGFAVDTQRSWLLLRMNSVHDHNQIGAVQIRGEIQPRRTEVKNFNVWS